MDSNLKRVANKILNADFNIPEEASDICADLILHLLVKNPSKRFTSEEVRTHHWLINSLEKKENTNEDKMGIFIKRDKQK
jgi:serine/threonine protein kinase